MNILRDLALTLLIGTLTFMMFHETMKEAKAQKAYERAIEYSEGLRRTVGIPVDNAFKCVLR